MTLAQLIDVLQRVASEPVVHPVTGQTITAGECPVCLSAPGLPAEVYAVVRDHWYIPAEPGGILYAGPHCLLTAKPSC